MQYHEKQIRNRAKELLKSGEAVRAFNVFESLRPSVISVLAQTGCEMVLVETEHISHNPETLTSFLVMARYAGLCPTVTIPEVSRTLVSRTLDAGALGICLSHSETPEQVDELVRWMKYAPVGERALAHGPNAGYHIEDASSYCNEANDATLLILKIESRLGLENAEEMVSNEWVDGVVFGPGDLAADMGLHGQQDHPDLINAMEAVAQIALSQSKAVESPVYATTSAEYRLQRERGFQIFGPIRTTEYDLLKKAAIEAIAPFK